MKKLPDGYTSETVNGVQYVKFSNTYFKPVMQGGEMAYVVTVP